MRSLLILMTVMGSLYQVGYAQPVKLSSVSNLSTPYLSQSTNQNCPIHQQAQSITVKVISDTTWGSGILIKKQGNTYTVVTNHHVLIFATQKSYQIQTPDGQLYQAKLVKNIEFGQKDLTLLQFDSQQNYTLASLQSVKKEQEAVFAAGFPLPTNNSEGPGFVCNSGQITMIMPQPLEGGYQIGYTNDVQKGMSGGPVLNSQGQVIAINGQGSSLWGNPYYALEDGTVLSDPKMIEEMEKLSWAIPINTLLELMPNFQSFNTVL